MYIEPSLSSLYPYFFFFLYSSTLKAKHLTSSNGGKPASHIIFIRVNSVLSLLSMIKFLSPYGFVDVLFIHSFVS